MSIEWLLTCFYIASGLFFLYSIKIIYSLFNLSWRLPYNIVKLLFSIVLSSLLFVFAQQLSGFISLDSKTPLAEADIYFIDEQKYRITLSRPDLLNLEYSFEIHGDMWQVDLRVISWHPFLAFLGLDTLYRFERVSGRYASLSDELKSPRSIYGLNEEHLTDPLWAYLNSFSGGVLFRAYYGASVYAPLLDSAKYGIYLTNTGVEVMPINVEAKRALKRW
tara:strand:- start:1754 stop:2413 length:660 start_codon:yes stop_codon:yes gene_type:complete